VRVCLSNAQFHLPLHAQERLVRIAYRAWARETSGSCFAACLAALLALKTTDKTSPFTLLGQIATSNFWEEKSDCARGSLFFDARCSCFCFRSRYWWSVATKFNGELRFIPPKKFEQHLGSVSVHEIASKQRRVFDVDEDRLVVHSRNEGWCRTSLRPCSNRLIYWYWSKFNGWGLSEVLRWQVVKLNVLKTRSKRVTKSGSSQFAPSLPVFAYLLSGLNKWDLLRS
jgi:hypothetical protein